MPTADFHTGKSTPGRTVLVLLVTWVVWFTPFEAVHSASFIDDFSFQSDARFSRQLDALRWNYTTGVDVRQGPYSFNLDHNFRSRLFLSDGEARNIQDENTIRLEASRRINDRFSLTADTYSYHFSATGLNQNTGHLGIQYRPHSLVDLTMAGGWMSDERNNEHDQGWSAQFRGSSRPFRVGEFMFRPEAEAHYAHIAPREYALYRIQTQANYFADEIQLRSNVFFSNGVQESYQPGSFFNRDIPDIIESVQNDSTALDLRATIPVSGSMNISIDLYSLNHTRIVESRPRTGEFSEPVYDTRTRRQEVHVQARGEYYYGQSFLSAGVSFDYVNRDSRLIHTAGLPEGPVGRRNLILRNSNFDQTRLELFTQNQITLSNRNELIIRAQSGILRYDTPEGNNDDRDELRHLVTVSNRHVFSPHLTMILHAGAEATHYVYLSATRSIENNWRRSLRLNPVIQWQPHDRIRWNHSFLARANYTVEDYQIEGRPKNDQSSREYAVRSDITLKVAEEWSVEANASRSELRIGRLYWDSFQETPTDTLVTYDVTAMVHFLPGNHRIGIGGRLFFRRDYLPQGTVTAEVPGEGGFPVPMSRVAPGVRYSRQLGPAVDVDLRFSSGNRLIIRGWVQRQQTWRNLYISYEEDVRPYFQENERQRTRRLYPNLEVRAVFNF
ncbi:hypothetical protein QLX67_06385 [Balneolaceae bacterium ANBcel3]|nr:hypothetical protein [Balneolaceae bacterium ANBcel3]